MDQSGQNLEVMQTWVREFCEARDWDQFHSAKDLAIGLVTESSELLELFRFQSEEECDKLLSSSEERSKVSDELADVFYFLLRFSDKYNFDLMKSLESKLKKNGLKYPVDAARSNNKKYDRL